MTSMCAKTFPAKFLPQFLQRNILKVDILYSGKPHQSRQNTKGSNSIRSSSYKNTSYQREKSAHLSIAGSEFKPHLNIPLINNLLVGDNDAGELIAPFLLKVSHFKHCFPFFQACFCSSYLTFYHYCRPVIKLLMHCQIKYSLTRCLSGFFVSK